ncbi:MAG TPA: IPExxxVDY family protein [Flavobacteriaceae bacterium]|nr:IPExxxVDY family protein [Flavobacteriaceae bacterium]
MSRNKQVLNLIPEEDFLLIGIHCQWEAYRVAYLLNKELDLRLKRDFSDLDFQYKHATAFYPVFHYNDEKAYREYYLVGNKFQGISQPESTSSELFGSEIVFTASLIPEHKTVDYILKVEEADGNLSPKGLASKINAIPQIRIAYAINTETLKSKENLIFN